MHQQNVVTSEGSVATDGIQQTSADSSDVFSLDSLRQSFTVADRLIQTLQTVSDIIQIYVTAKTNKNDIVQISTYRWRIVRG